MAGEFTGSAIIKDYIAGVDLSGFKNRWVAQSGTVDNAVIAPTGATDMTAGILLNAPTLGQVAQVLVHGLGKVIAGGTIARKVRVSPLATGLSVASATTNFISGITQESAVVNQLQEVFVQISLTPLP